MNFKFTTVLLFAFLLLSSCRTSAQKTASSEIPRSDLINAEQLLRDVETLSSDAMEGRKVGTPGSRKAQEYLLRRFKESGLQPLEADFLQPFEFSAKKDEKIAGANLVGVVKGKRQPDKFIVVTAHYDHLGVRGSEIYNGADDNASGTGAILALAKYFSRNPPANSIIFASLDAEEGSGAGARKLVETLLVDKKTVVLNVNLDMVSHSEKGELYASGTFHYPFLKPYLEKQVAGAKVKLLFGHDKPGSGSDDWTTQSDHFAFHQKQIPFIYFGVEDHKDYHRPTDEFSTITREFYVRAVETILAAVREFDANLDKIEQQKAAAAPR